METVESFKARAFAHTGISFDDLPDVPPESLLEGQILCQRDGCFVVTQGYPVSEDPETGVPVYGAFGVVDRARLWEPAGAATPQVGDLAEILKGLTTEADLERHGRRHLHSLPNRDASPVVDAYAHRLGELCAWRSQPECEARAAQWMREGIRSAFEGATPQIGMVVAMGGVAVVVDHAPDGTARLVYEREDSALLAGDAVRGWDKADEHEALLYRAAEPWNRG